MTRELFGLLVVVAACEKSPSPPTIDEAPKTGSAAVAVQPARPRCVRQREAHEARCSGIDPGANPPATAKVSVCDGCASNADCTAQPGGTCEMVGGQGCEPPAAYVCRYPGDLCQGCVYCTHDGKGAPVCQPAPPPMPASMPH